MGSLASTFFKYARSLFQDDPPNVLMLGIDKAGKTSILYRIVLNETVATIPTIAYHVETIKIDKVASFIVWDISSLAIFHRAYRHYFQNTHGLIFVLDSSDKLRFDEARDFFQDVVNDPQMIDKPIVVLANKSDLPGAANNEEIVECFGLNKLHRIRWIIYSTSAITGQGISEAMVDIGTSAKQFKEKKR